jgi:hypothetical protein
MDDGWKITDDEVINITWTGHTLLEQCMTVAFAAQKKLVQWGDELCREHKFLTGADGNIVPIPRKLCLQCWQSVMEELGVVQEMP